MANAKKPAAILTEKMGPLPMWGWLAVVGAGVFVLTRVGGGAAKPAAAGATPAMPDYLAYPTYSSGGGLSGATQPQVFVLPGSSTTETGAGAGTTGTPGTVADPNNPLNLPHQQKLGPLGGYYPGPTYTQPIGGYGGGQYVLVPSPAAADALPSGTELFWEPQPGLFVNTPSPWVKGQGAGIAGPTPLYVRTNA